MIRPAEVLVVPVLSAVVEARKSPSTCVVGMLFLLEYLATDISFDAVFLL